MSGLIKVVDKNIQSIKYKAVAETRYKWYSELPSYKRRYFGIFFETIPAIKAGWDIKEDSRYNYYGWEDERKTSDQLVSENYFMTDHKWFKKGKLTITYTEGNNVCKVTDYFIDDEAAMVRVKELEEKSGLKMVALL